MSGKTVGPVLLGEDYRALFNSIDQGFCVIELIFDDDDRPVDYRFLEINTAFEQQTGLQDAVGKLVRDFLPDHDQHWFEIYGRIAKTGQPERFTNEATQLDRWYDVYAFRVGEPESRRVAVLFHDISERRRAEEKEHRAAEIARYRAGLADALRPLADPTMIGVVATRLLGEQLAANRVTFAEIDGGRVSTSSDFVDGVLSIAPTRFEFSDFGSSVLASLRAGQAVINVDTEAGALGEDEIASYRGSSVRAFIAMPLVRAGLLVSVLGVHQANPRKWTEHDLALVEETIERTWEAVKRARAETALNSSERRLRLATEAADVFSWEVDLATGTFETSKNVDEILGFRPASLEEGWALVHRDDIGRVRKEFERAIQTGGEFSAEYRMMDPDGTGERWVFTVLTAIGGGAQDSTRVFGITQNITERKRLENNAHVAADRDYFRAKLADILRPLANPFEIQSEAARVLGEHLGVNRAIYSEIDGDDYVIMEHFAKEVPLLPLGRYPIASYGQHLVEAFIAGRSFNVTDTETDPRFSSAVRAAYTAISVRAFASVPLVKAGRLAAVFGVHHQTARKWSSQELALIEETAEHTWAAVERARAESALARSEEQYRALFNSMDQGFCVVEVLFSEDGKPLDYRFLETNAIFDEQTGLKNAHGRTARELVPSLEQRWFEIYGKVAMTGEPNRFVEGSEAMGRWFDVYAFRVGAADNRHVAILFTDISARERAEQMARATSDRNRFRLELADALRPLVDPSAIQGEATRVLGKHLQTNRVAYAEIDGDWLIISDDYVDGVSSIAGRYRFAEFRQSIEPDLRSGLTVVVSDIETRNASETESASYAAMSIRALVAVPLVKAGQLVAVLAVHHAHPRQWTEHDVVLTEETAERTWATLERAKAEAALSASEERLRLATQAAAMYNWEVDPSTGTFEGPENAEEIVSFPIPKSLAEAWSAVHPDDVAGLRSAFEQGIEDGGGFSYEYRIRVPEGVDEVWAFSAGKVIPATGLLPMRVVGVTQNISKRKRIESSLRERQAADRDARRRAEFLTALMSELEAIESVDGRARRLVELVVPRLADFAAVLLPGEESGIVSSGHGDPDIELPLPLGVNQIGSLRLGFKVGRSASPEDLRFAREIAERAALLIGNARLRAEEHRIARGLQNALLPMETLQSPEVAIAARYEAGSDGLDVGGDWYDSFSLPNQQVGLAVGDVVGTGLDAAAAMGRIRNALVALAGQTDSPGQLLSQLDEFVSGPNGSDFATACYAILDPSTGELRYASAAHPPILLLTPAGETRWLEGGRSLPLGGASVSARPEASIFLEPGSLLIFYSDGLVERRGESLSVGLDRLAQASKAHVEAPVEELCESLASELGAGPAADDDTVIMCVRLVPASSRPFQRTFPARPEELSRLRMAVREWLSEHQIGEQERFDLLLALGEACTNAVEHAYKDRYTADVEVEIRADDQRLHVRVRDFGEWKEPAGTNDKRERGTSIMMKLTEDFRRDTGEKGTVVTFSVPMAAEVST